MVSATACTGSIVNQLECVHDQTMVLPAPGAIKQGPVEATHTNADKVVQWQLQAFLGHLSCHLRLLPCVHAFMCGLPCCW
jgi:hypothetical protein